MWGERKLSLAMTHLARTRLNQYLNFVRTDLPSGEILDSGEIGRIARFRRQDIHSFQLFRYLEVLRNFDRVNPGP